ncbi:MICOS complex subunit MIC19 isoform X1 [Sagmatias obliquidens]|uniref:MICOS complex subunit MIC19 isoform X1 n=1 Tax=Tursiops truncatus TaxID=9739 RepID=A0A6J3RY01_TURTR|nr:MICOS complex subunit MIC19 isoform X1 [Lagenorhynchus obliquidens]XP_033719174.1 MICOS complex subunit MIC19 isoform X1 [Tursiops truncatus]
MGGTASTRRVTFEADENENITVVKGIRLSENVIDRMKETSPSGPKSQRYSGAYGASVSDEELKRRVAEELALEEAKKESENQKRLKQSKELDSEKAFANEQLTRAILRERISNEEERAKAKHLAKQLEEKDRVIKKQDAFYKEQLARLEERSSEFYKVTTEQYQKAAEEVEAKFKRYECHPICADLQAQILQCYRQNTQQTLSCSALASQYKQCVNQAKQNPQASLTWQTASSLYKTSWRDTQKHLLCSAQPLPSPPWGSTPFVLQVLLHKDAQLLGPEN